MIPPYISYLLACSLLMMICLLFVQIVTCITRHLAWARREQELNEIRDKAIEQMAIISEKLEEKR